MIAQLTGSMISVEDGRCVSTSTRAMAGGAGSAESVRVEACTR
jgi:hypothetical protein